jgi:hypothetical protein
MSSNALVPSPAGVGAVITADDFMPFAVEKVLARKEAIDNITSKLLIKGVDFGVHPGSGNPQKVLKKAGAEKLCSAFGLAPRIIQETKTLDWTGAEHNGEPFFSYEYRIGLYRGDLFLGEATASCNSWEKKYRYQWVSEDEARDRADFDKLPKRGGKKLIFEPDFAINKKETTGRYGKPLEYWHRFEEAIRTSTAQRTEKQMGKRSYEGYQIVVDDAQVRIPNPSAPDCVNTVQKMAYKRTLVAAVVVITNCSDGFSQDLDDEEEESQPTRELESDPRTDPPVPETPPPSQQPVAGRPVPEDMRAIIENVRQKLQIKEAYHDMWRRFQSRGEDAARAHEYSNQQFRNRFPKMTSSTIEDHVNQLLDLRELLQKYPEPVRA